MRKLIGLVLFLGILSGCGITRVEPGYEGIRVNLWGEGRGVEEVTIVTGRVIYWPIKEDVFQFPTHFVGYVWTADSTEDSPVDEAVSFTTNDKVAVKVDVEARLRFKEGRTPHVFVDHRLPPDAIVRGYIRGRVRDAFVRCGGNVNSMDILGGGGVITLQDCAKTWLNENLGDNYEFDVVTVASAPQVAAEIRTMIEDTVAATQEAQRAQQQVAIREAEARQKVAVAEGEALSILRVAEAQAEANRLLNASITPSLVNYEAMKKWDGKSPQVLGAGATPFIQLK